MDLVFSTHDLPAARRYRAWQDALCELYVHVDSHSDSTDDYHGFVKEARFGELTITDCYLSPQEINRRPNHIAHIDKDCFYLSLTQKGLQTAEQRGQCLSFGPGEACLFSASEPYTLRNGVYRAFYLEIAREAMARRWAPSRPLLTAKLNTAYGLGRIVASMCGAMVLEANTLQDPARVQLGEKLIDLLALALDCGPADTPLCEGPVRDERMRQIKSYINANIGNPLLNPERVARANQLSVRALHYLFKKSGQSVSDYIWEQRLERCRAELQSGTSSRTITEIAFASGFNSMSHFSSAFRRRFGISPSSARVAPLV